MNKQKEYEKLADEILDATLDIYSVLDGSNKDFSMNEFLVLRKIKNRCEGFINKLNEYQKAYYGNKS